MLTIGSIIIPREELSFTFSRSGGPGGQNVNKVSSKVTLRWNPAGSRALPEAVKKRLLAQQRSRLTREGDLLVGSQRFRDQGRNLEDCLNKLRELVVQALHPPKARKKTRPTRGSRERRLAEKKLRSERKRQRRDVQH